MKADRLVGLTARLSASMVRRARGRWGAGRVLGAAARRAARVRRASCVGADTRTVRYVVQVWEQWAAEVLLLARCK